MTRTLNISKSALLVGAFFLLAFRSFGQPGGLELLPGSDKLSYDAKTGIHKLLGNVNFIYQGNTMYCDSAYYFERQQAVRAYGKVHINKRDTLNLFCDSLFYDGKTRMAKLWGNVRVRDNEYKLSTDTLEYDAKKGQAFYKHGGKVESILSQEKLTSRIGYFHPDTKNFFFSNKVVYKSPQIAMTTDTLRYLYSKKTAYFFGPTDILTDSTKLYCESGFYQTETGEGSLFKNAHIDRGAEYISGDTLIYQPLLGTSIGRGNVFYSDTTQKMHFNGDYAFISDSLHYSLLTGHAIATKELASDTLYIHADTLYSYKKDSVEFLKAYYGARIYSTEFQAKADSLSYSPQNNRMELFHQPIVWSKGAELKGRFMEIELKDSVVERVNIIDSATILMEVEPIEYYNQIGGNKIIAYFVDNNLTKALVNGNAMTIFFPEDTESTDSAEVIKRMGMNRLYSSDLRIDVDSNEITGVTYLDAPDGVFYPMDQIKKSEQFVPGFNWKAALRPKSRESLLED